MGGSPSSLVAGVTPGQSGWQRRLCEADRGNPLRGSGIPMNEKEEFNSAGGLNAGTICIDDKSTLVSRRVTLRMANHSNLALYI